VERRESQAMDENIGTIKIWEEAALKKRSPAEQISETITRIAGGGGMLVAHVVWFGAWLAINTGSIPAIAPFDAFPFPLLTTLVSLEAIFLSLFVLASQNRMTRHSDQRSQLDLQVNLLAEKEMTAVLVLLQDIAKHMDVKVSLTPEYVRDLAKQTDIHKLTQRLEELPKD
jgi:uncharacterized membrane protein